MVINYNPLVTDHSWLQEGYSYGIGDSGPWQRFSRRGLNSDIEGWYDTLINAGWIVTVTREKVASGGYGISNLEATAGWAFPYLYGTENPENIWELDPEDIQKPLLEVDFPNGSIYSISSKTRAQIPKMIEFASGNTLAKWKSTAFGGLDADGVTSNGWIFEDGHAPEDDIQGVIYLPAADYASAKSLFYLMTAGNEVFPMEASIIRHSQITSNLYSVAASYNNVSRIISTSSMYSIEGVPGLLLFSIPTEPTVSQYIEDVGDLQYGWRKVRPAISRLSRMKWRITQNYQFGLWPIKTFGNVL